MRNYLLVGISGAFLGWLIPNMVDWHLQWIFVLAFYMAVAIGKLISVIRNARYGVKRGR